jgi:hypothetical protein
MLWFLAALVLILLAIWSGTFRKVLLVVGGLAVALAVVIWAYLSIQGEQNRKEFEASKTRIQSSEIELVDVGLQPGYGPGDYKLVGRARNKNSSYTLGELNLQITLEDCIRDKCEVIGQKAETIYLNAPPGQSRDFDEYVSFPGVKAIKGELQWNYRLVFVTGKRD